VSAFALWYAWVDFRSLPGSPFAAVASDPRGTIELFSGLLVYDSLTAWIRLLLMRVSGALHPVHEGVGHPRPRRWADFYTLVLGRRSACA
jgi:hypothetical protein